MNSGLGRRALLAGTVGMAGAIFVTPLGDAEYAIGHLSAENIPGPLSLSVEVLDADILVDSPGIVKLSLTNGGSTPITLRNQGVVPFGVLHLNGTGPRTLLISPSYDESGRITLRDRGRGGLHVRSDQLSVILEPTETLSEEYEIHGDLLYDEGTYTMENMTGPLLRYEQEGVPEIQEVTPTIEIRIESRNRPLL